ncbi:tripartite motif-containing protein 29-like [Salmo trutta]|nr:tripartite motif-containing protein 29-like [Salmo trutta]
MLAELVEKLKTGLQAVPLVHCYAGPGDVECDVCTGRKCKAFKSCLVCLASYCETHLQPHYDSPAFKKHRLVKSSTQLQERICSRHDKLLEIYCHSDQHCICLLCLMDEHKGHETVSAASEGTEKQKLLDLKQTTYQQMIQERERELRDIKLGVFHIIHFADESVENSERIFTEMIRSIERCSEVKELIRPQERAAVSGSEGLQERLKQEVAELGSRGAELEQLSHTEDHIHFLQIVLSLIAKLDPKGVHSPSCCPCLWFKDVTRSVSELKERLEKICQEEVEKIPSKPNAWPTTQPLATAACPPAQPLAQLQPLQRTQLDPHSPPLGLDSVDVTMSSNQYKHLHWI